MARPATKSTALWVVRRLRKAGYAALFAGGCVRDMLLGKRSADYDVATDAGPRDVKELFSHVLLIGEKFGVAMVVHHGRKVEVATFRSDSGYSDGRRPDSVRFSSPRQDALRRDFTINGMFYDPVTDEIIDYVNGRADLARQVVRTIGCADDRFGEDYLRMLRAVRFAVRLDFTLQGATAGAVARHAGKIGAISGERIFAELTKMLSIRSAPKALALMNELGLAREILPELFESEGLWSAGCARAEALAGRKDLVLTLGALVCELGARSISRIVRRWGASNELRCALGFLADNLPLASEAPDMPLCDFKRLMANRNFPRLLAIWRAHERLGTRKALLWARSARRARSIDPALVAPEPLVTGTDLIELGLTQGPALGEICRRLYDLQLDEELSSRSSAMTRAKELVRAAGTGAITRPRRKRRGRG